MIATLLIIISQLRFIDYNHHEEYQWPDNTYTSASELRFVTYDELPDVKKGDEVCFVFEEVSPQEVCGKIRANVDFGLNWVVMDITSGE